MSCDQLLAASHPIPLQDRRVSRHIHLMPEPSAAKEARSFVRQIVAGMESNRLDDLLIITSELVTNAVLHARTPLEVGVVTTDALVLVCVGDLVGGEPISPAPSSRRENGRGIMLVRALADDWGVAPEMDSNGKSVWFVVRRRADDGALQLREDEGSHG